MAAAPWQHLGDERHRGSRPHREGPVPGRRRGRRLPPGLRRPLSKGRRSTSIISNGPWLRPPPRVTRSWGDRTASARHGPSDVPRGGEAAAHGRSVGQPPAGRKTPPTGLASPGRRPGPASSGRSTRLTVMTSSPGPCNPSPPTVPTRNSVPGRTVAQRPPIPPPAGPPLATGTQVTVGSGGVADALHLRLRPTVDERDQLPDQDRVARSRRRPSGARAPRARSCRSARCRASAQRGRPVGQRRQVGDGRVVGSVGHHHELDPDLALRVVEPEPARLGQVRRAPAIGVPGLSRAASRPAAPAWSGSTSSCG